MNQKILLLSFSMYSIKNEKVIVLLLLLLISCNSKTRIDDREPILIADREAPIGWIYLRIYQDSTFEFESRGLRTRNIYTGKAEISKDTIRFNYQDSIPKAGQTAVYNKYLVAYIDGAYPEKVRIKMSKLINE